MVQAVASLHTQTAPWEGRKQVGSSMVWAAVTFLEYTLQLFSSLSCYKHPAGRAVLTAEDQVVSEKAKEGFVGWVRAGVGGVPSPFLLLCLQREPASCEAPGGIGHRAGSRLPA